MMPTDTIYGLVGSAFSKKAVERIYKVRKRERNKPFIVLISSLNELKKFGVRLPAAHLEILKKLWPGPVSVILPVCQTSNVQCQKFRYLHRGKNTIAFRLPKARWLRNLLKKTGPLVAPSANIAGRPPSFTIRQAKKYFGNKVNFYLDKGILRGRPSSIVELKR